MALSIEECPSCHTRSTNSTFKKSHLWLQILTVRVRIDLALHVSRDPETNKFGCPWTGCLYHDCDSEEMKNHVLICNYRPAVLKKPYYGDTHTIQE